MRFLKTDFSADTTELTGAQREDCLVSILILTFNSPLLQFVNVSIYLSNRQALSKFPRYYWLLVWMNWKRCSQIPKKSRDVLVLSKF